MEDTKAFHLRCVRTTLCPIAARLTSREKVVIEATLKENSNTVFIAGSSQTWPVAVLIQPTTTSPAAGPPASSWRLKLSANTLLPPQLTFPAFTPNAMYISLPENKTPFHERIPPRFATIWRMMLEPARDQRSCNPNSGDNTSQFSLLWLGEQSLSCLLWELKDNFCSFYFPTAFYQLCCKQIWTRWFCARRWSVYI